MGALVCRGTRNLLNSCATKTTKAINAIRLASFRHSLVPFGITNPIHTFECISLGQLIQEIRFDVCKLFHDSDKHLFYTKPPAFAVFKEVMHRHISDGTHGLEIFSPSCRASKEEMKVYYKLIEIYSSFLQGSHTFTETIMDCV